MSCEILDCCKDDPFEYQAGQYDSGFFNEVQTFTAVCPEGYIGQKVTVTIPPMTYHSTTSQATVNLTALTAAQTQAEAQLVCYAGLPE
jgi:hypothetical protein